MGIENYSVSGNHHELNRTSFDGNTFKGTEWNNTSHVTNDKNNGVEFVFGEGMNLKLNSRYNNGGDDVFPTELMSVQEDLAIARYRKRGAEGDSSYSLADEKVTFSDALPQDVKERLYPYRRLSPR